VHVVSQHTPPTQKPEAHWLADVHPRPKLASYSRALFRTVDPFRPPATRIMLLPRGVAVWPCDGGDGIDGVAVQVLVPLKSSADVRVPLPLLPPATSTVPFATIDWGNTVALWPNLADVIVPADDQLPLLKPGSKISAVASVVEPFLPPVTRIFPFVFGRTLAVCCSRGPEIDASVENAFCTGS
jgi:hypothetical protein